MPAISPDGGASLLSGCSWEASRPLPAGRRSAPDRRQTATAQCDGVAFARAKSRTRVADSGSHRGLEAGDGHRRRLQPGAVEPGARHEAVGSGRGRAPHGPVERGPKDAPSPCAGRHAPPSCRLGSYGDLDKTERLWQSLKFIAGFAVEITETTLFDDIVLPFPSALERCDF